MLTFRVLLLSSERKTKRIFAELAERLSAEVVNPDCMAHAEMSIRREPFAAIFADAEFPGLSRQGLVQVVGDSRPNRRTATYLMSGYAPSAGTGRLPEEGLIIVGKPASAEELLPLLERLKARIATERRRVRRLSFRVDVQILQGARRGHGTSQNLSRQGMLLATDLLLERGAEFELRFLLPGEDKIFQARARVARIVAPKVVGVNFLNLGPFERQRLQEFLTQRLGEHPEAGRGAR